MKTNDPRFLVTESLEPLDELANDLIILDVEEKSYLYEYSDADIMNAVIVFYHVLSNRFAHNQTKAGNFDPKLAHTMGLRIHALVQEMTSVDTYAYYNDFHDEVMRRLKGDKPK